MKIIILPIVLTVFAAFTLPLSAQGDLVDKLAVQTCECISKKGPKNLSAEELQTQLGFCMLEAIGQNEAAFKKKYGDVSFTDQAAMTKVGEEVGTAMVYKCPDVMMKLAQTEIQSQPAATAAATGEINGTVKAIEGSELAQIVITDESGRAQKLVWFGYFEGSERFINEPRKTIGKKVKVEYREIEAYSPQAREYYARKEVLSITFLN
ncbi:MAG: hypothetical protein HY842_02350 [Bacteroidetes bacterium]|nr:hypothetical protein [Bacteroidota bacterium]